MNSVNVLHLSDLHIGGEDEDPAFERLRTALLMDIKKEFIDRGVRIDAVAMTGDVVDKGGSDHAYQIATAFFQQLLAELGLDASRLMLVPGNHDVPRPDWRTARLTNSLQESDLVRAGKSAETWESCGGRFAKFSAFKTGIGIPAGYELFGASVQELSLPAGTVRFLLLNSAWTTQGDADRQTLWLGRWQIEQLAKTMRGQSADLTLVLMHHPVEWLRESEKTMLRNYLLPSQWLPADAILHGHIHTGEIEVYENPDGRLLSLVSGIGYPMATETQGSIPRLSKCRYALYRFSVDSGELHVQLRISNDKGRFYPDHELYSRGAEFTIRYREPRQPEPPPQGGDPALPQEPTQRPTHGQPAPAARKVPILSPTILTLPGPVDQALIPLVEDAIERLTGYRPIWYRADAGSMVLYLWLNRDVHDHLWNAYRSGQLADLIGHPIADLKLLQRSGRPPDARRVFSYEPFCLDLLRLVQQRDPRLRGSYRRAHHGVQWFRAGTDMPYYASFIGSGLLEIGLTISTRDLARNRKHLDEVLPLLRDVTPPLSCRVHPHAATWQTAIKVAVAKQSYHRFQEGPSIRPFSYVPPDEWTVDTLLRMDRALGPWIAAHSRWADTGPDDNLWG